MQVLVMHFFTGIVKKLLKKQEIKKSITNLLWSKLNSIESKISEALINSEISNEDFMTIINEEKKISRTKRKH